MGLTAMYPGECAACDEPIKPGQKITRPFNERRYIHAECPEPAPEIKREVCKTCFQEKAANGSCDCDE
jgi:hypothetical protein